MSRVSQSLVRAISFSKAGSCSVVCFKRHQESCTGETRKRPITPPPTRTLDQGQIHKLEASKEELRHVLRDPALQSIIREILAAEDPLRRLQEYRTRPQFDELCKRLLNILQC
jgi:hypothetical protein